MQVPVGIDTQFDYNKGTTRHGIRTKLIWSVKPTRVVFKVSSTVRTREELEMVYSRVDALLATLQARPGAVCAVRERIFSELYDELIREVNGI